MKGCGTPPGLLVNLFIGFWRWDYVVVVLGVYRIRCLLVQSRGFIA